MRKVLSFAFVLVLLLGMFGISVYADTGTDDITVIADLLSGASPYVLVLFGVLGGLVFLVQLIVQLTKEFPKIRAVPTKLWAIIISLFVTETLLFVYTAWSGIAILWYYPVLAIFAAFVVSYISTYGWDSLHELWKRYSRYRL